MLIPSVVGLRGDGLEWTVELTSTVALHVIADVPEHSQRALAAGLIRCEEVGTSLGPSKLTAADALREAEERVPGAVAWAREFTEGSTITPKRFAARSAPSVMRCTGWCLRRPRTRTRGCATCCRWASPPPSGSRHTTTPFAPCRSRGVAPAR